MQLIQNFSNDALQRQRVLLPDGSSFQLTLNFKPLQFGWFITELEYGDFKLQGMRLCISPNILHQFKNQLPFGIALFSTGSVEPMLQQDLSSGNVKLYLLNAAEVHEYAEYLSGQAGP